MVSWDSTTQASEGFSSDESHMTFHSPSPASHQSPVAPLPSSSESKSESESTLTSLPKIQQHQQQKKYRKRKKQQEEEEENDKISEPPTKNEALHAVQQENIIKENNKILKVEALERKWHKLHILELEVFLARLDYLKEECKISLEELRKPVRRARYEGYLPRNDMACFRHGF